MLAPSTVPSDAMVTGLLTNGSRAARTLRIALLITRLFSME